MPETLPPSPANTAVPVPLLTPPSTTRNRISTILYAIPRLFARRNELRYSFPVVVLDTIWNLAFVVMSAVMLILTAKEKPDVLIRFWLAGRMLNCVVHVVQMLLEYNTRNRRVAVDLENSNSSGSTSTGIAERLLIWRTRILAIPTSRGFRFLRGMGELYMFGFFECWWMAGLFWTACDAETLQHDSPRLYCIPSGHQREESTAEIGVLHKYSFEVSNDEKEPDGKARRMVSVLSNSPALSSVRVLQAEDSDCCICICQYEDGAELHLLPCNHHFHAACLVKWIRVKATCPLCKYIIDPIEQV